MRKEQRDPEPQVWFNDRFDTSDAEEHRAQMFAALDLPANRFVSLYGEAEARRGDALPIRATSQAESAYLPWVGLKEIGAGPPFNGLLEKRGGALIDCDRDVLAIRTRAYFDPALSWEEAKPRIGGLAENAGRFPARRTREELVGNRGRRFEEQAILRYHLRPFDVRSAYVMPDRPLWNEPRPELLRQLPTAGNFLATRPAAARAPKACP